jgi:diguanylate cyclase (GGDEF)-like protein/PAS domain S-box-containing protein
MAKRIAKSQILLIAENEDLRTRLAGAEEALRAILTGEVDALVVPSYQGKQQFFTLKGADYSYRVLVEQMGEGALMLSLDGIILYCNHRFAEMVASPIEQVIGKNIRVFVNPSSHSALDSALGSKRSERQDIECELGDGMSTPVRLTLVYLPQETPKVFGLTAADLTDFKHREMELVQARDSLEKRVVERTTELQLEIAERKQMGEKLKLLSMHDALTGLYNRGFFDEEMKRFERGRQYPVSIVMADINSLKEINDRDGHAAGDALLQSAAQVLKTTFRNDDIVARIGGDEFAVLLPETDAESAGQLLLRVRGTLDKYNEVNSGPHLSIAFGSSTALQGDSLTDALKEADRLMYENKNVRGIKIEH